MSRHSQTHTYTRQKHRSVITLQITSPVCVCVCSAEAERENGALPLDRALARIHARPPGPGGAPPPTLPFPPHYTPLLPAHRGGIPTTTYVPRQHGQLLPCYLVISTVRGACSKYKQRCPSVHSSPTLHLLCRLGGDTFSPQATEGRARHRMHEPRNETYQQSSFNV